MALNGLGLTATDISLGTTIKDSNNVKIIPNLKDYLKAIVYDEHFLLLQLIQEVVEEQFDGFILSRFL